LSPGSGGRPSAAAETSQACQLANRDLRDAQIFFDTLALRICCCVRQIVLEVSQTPYEAARLLVEPLPDLANRRELLAIELLLDDAEVEAL